MGIRSEQRQVMQDVKVTECDGPGCNVQLVDPDRYAQKDLPTSWFGLKQSPTTYSRLEAHALNEPVIFHSWKCLVGWMDHHRLSPTQVNVPLIVGHGVPEAGPSDETDSETECRDED